MNFDPNQPIYLQLIEEFKRRISTGIWPPGEKVPSVRSLASDLSVNPNTVQKALSELDRSGLTSSERTSGRIVTAGFEEIKKAGRDLSIGATREYLEKMRGLNLSLNDVQNIIEKEWTKNSEEKR